MAALFGVLSVVNVYTGTMFDIIFIYLMTVALAYYTFKFNEKMAVLVLFTSTFILFLTGELFFTLYSFFTLPLGILYIYCIKKKIDGKWILRVYSMLKNYIVLFLLNSFREDLYFSSPFFISSSPCFIFFCPSLICLFALFSSFFQQSFEPLPFLDPF